MLPLTRRDFVKTTAAVAAGIQLPAVLQSLGQTPPESGGVPVELHWIEGGIPSLVSGTTWGVPWPSGAMKADRTFALQTDKGDAVPVQSWPLAYWPDGSLKWTAHAIGANAGLSEKLQLAPGTPAVAPKVVAVQESGDAIEIDTGVIHCKIAKHGQTIFQSLERDGHPVATDAKLVCLVQDRSGFAKDGTLRQVKFNGTVTLAAVEQSGPVRGVVRLEGTHQGANGRKWLPFTIRLYFYAGSEAVRIMHSFVFDGDQNKDFIQGLGVTFSVPMKDAAHDRHVRFVGEDKGIWAEAVRNLSGLRRDAGPAVTQAQVAGKACPPVDQFPPEVKRLLEEIPVWNDYTLYQASADSFEVRKRTGGQGSWLTAGHGNRSMGVGYVGSISGGAAFGLRGFWQRFPTQLDIRGAGGDVAEATIWLWSPDAQPMDLRHYDNKGHDLLIVYEDWEEGFSTPMGVARTNEMMIWALPATPDREQLLGYAGLLQTPPLLACDPGYYHGIGLFGSIWSLPDRSTPAKKRIEEQLDWLTALYLKEVDQRHWYGFWNYGDIMHAYDKDRHVWRYDVGGYAWANSELSPDLWLWYTYLRTGRADIFRLAEAMTRHTGEVDVHHLGRFAGLGSRHNVSHWGDSGKQVRVSLSAYRRFYYYLTADERVGDLMRQLVDSDHALVATNPVRKLPNQPPNPHPANASAGPDWFAFCSNWLTEWERTGNPKYRDKMIVGMKCLGAMPHGFYSGDRFGYDPDTGKLYNINGNNVAVSHLSAVFGAVEIGAEMISLLDVPEFTNAWLQYCELYNAAAEERQKALGVALKHDGLAVAHSRLTAYAAWKKKDPALAKRAWTEFLKGDNRSEWQRLTLKTFPVSGPDVLNPIEEVPWMATNDAAQWSLAAIQNLELAGDAAPSEDPWPA